MYTSAIKTRMTLPFINSTDSGIEAIAAVGLFNTIKTWNKIMGSKRRWTFWKRIKLNKDTPDAISEPWQFRIYSMLLLNEQKDCCQLTYSVLLIFILILSCLRTYNRWHWLIYTYDHQLYMSISVLISFLIVLII